MGWRGMTDYFLITMKTIIWDWMALLGLLFVLVGCSGGLHEQDGVFLFSVGEGRQVVFAEGNLAEGGCGFVDKQWEYGGLFGWGTGDRPQDTTDSWQAYTQFVEWGDIVGGGWRTLTAEEWKYLLFEREGAAEKRAVGTVNGVHGLLVLPDEWELPAGCRLTFGAKGWDENSYEENQWEKMENAGAVLLPAAGFRWGGVGYAEDCEGLYWSKTVEEEGCPYTMHFDGSIMGVDWDNTPHYGQSVRMVRESDQIEN